MSGTLHHASALPTWPCHGSQVSTPHVWVQTPGPRLLQARGSSDQGPVGRVGVLQQTCAHIQTLRHTPANSNRGREMDDTCTLHVRPHSRTVTCVCKSLLTASPAAPAAAHTCRQPVAWEYSMSACAWRSSRVCTRPNRGLLLPCTSAASRDSMLMAGRPSRSAKPAGSTHTHAHNTRLSWVTRL